MVATMNVDVNRSEKGPWAYEIKPISRGRYIWMDAITKKILSAGPIIIKLESRV